MKKRKNSDSLPDVGGTYLEDEPRPERRKRKPTFKRNHVDIFQDTVETLELTIRSARRCAYDLTHCADALASKRPGSAHDAEMAKLFRERAEFFVKVFQSGNSMKDYRLKLHHEIAERDQTIQQLRALLAENGIKDPTEF